MQNEKRLEIRKALQPVRKEIVKTLLADDNLTDFEHKYNDGTPLKKLSAPAVAFQIAHFFEYLPRVEDNLEQAVQASRYIYRCGSCRKYISGLSYCQNCDKCMNCCNCEHKPTIIAKRAEIQAILDKPIKKIKIVKRKSVSDPMYMPIIPRGMASYWGELTNPQQSGGQNV
jgi:hypothetical protein